MLWYCAFTMNWDVSAIDSEDYGQNIDRPWQVASEAG
jgi:hypothetical protein